MLKYKKNPTLSQGGIDIGLKVGILAEIGYMLHECAVGHNSHWIRLGFQRSETSYPHLQPSVSFMRNKYAISWS